MPAGTFAVTTMTWCRAVLCGSKPNTGQTQAEQAPRADMSKQTCSLPLSLQHIPVTWKFCEGQQTLGVQLICHFYSPSHTEAAWERPCKLPADMSKQTCSLPLSWQHIPVTWKVCEQSEADASQVAWCSYMTRTTLAAMMAHPGSSSTSCQNRHEQAVVTQLPCQDNLS